MNKRLNVLKANLDIGGGGGIVKSEARLLFKARNQQRFGNGKEMTETAKPS